MICRLANTMADHDAMSATSAGATRIDDRVRRLQLPKLTAHVDLRRE